MASIHPRPRGDGTVAYRVMFRIGNKQVSEGFDDAATAESFRLLVERIGGQAARDLRGARTAAAGTPTLAAWFETYLTSLTGVTAGTVAEYRRLADRTWMPQLGELPVDMVAKEHVTAWVGKQAKTLTRRGTPTAAKTIKNAHSLLSSTIFAAVEEGLRGSNPCRGVTLPKGQREEMTFLTESEFAQLLGVVPAYWQPLVLTFAGTGLRWGEATALQWRDVDLDADVPVLRVARAFKRGVSVRELGAPKTSRSRRTISLPPEVVDALRPLQGKGEAHVFTGPAGGLVHHQVFHPRIWRPAVAQAGIGKTPRIHDLRHTHASWLIAAGVPLPIVQRRLGHESIQTTVDTYGHLADNALQIASDASSRALSLAVPTLLADVDEDGAGGAPALLETGPVADVERAADPASL